MTQREIAIKLLDVKKMKVTFGEVMEFVGRTTEDDELIIRLHDNHIDIEKRGTEHTFYLDDVKEVYYWEYDTTIDITLQFNVMFFDKEINFSFNFERTEETEG